MNQRKHLMTASISMVIAIVLGAMGAHYLKETLELPIEKLESWKTGVFYQIIHSLGIFLVVILAQLYKIEKIGIIVNLFLFGILFFSGSIYLLTLNHVWNIEFLKILGPITPIGGLMFIAGWIVLFLSILKLKTE